jgi:hypothetical protein
LGWWVGGLGRGRRHKQWREGRGKGYVISGGFQRIGCIWLSESDLG